MNEIAEQRLHSRPSVSTLRSSVFIRGGLMLKLTTLYAVKVTSSTSSECSDDLLPNRRDNFLSCFIFSLIDALRSLEQQNSSTHRISKLSNKTESSRKMYDHSEPRRCIEWRQSSIRNLRKEKPVFSISLNPFLLQTGGLNLKLYGNNLFSLNLKSQTVR